MLTSRSLYIRIFILCQVAIAGPPAKRVAMSLIWSWILILSDAKSTNTVQAKCCNIDYCRLLSRIDQLVPYGILHLPANLVFTGKYFLLWQKIERQIGGDQFSLDQNSKQSLWHSVYLSKSFGGMSTLFNETIEKIRGNEGCSPLFAYVGRHDIGMT